MDKCFLCQSECKRAYVEGEARVTNYIVVCERCGEYVITMDVELDPPDDFVQRPSISIIGRDTALLGSQRAFLD